MHSEFMAVEAIRIEKLSPSKDHICQQKIDLIFPYRKFDDYLYQGSPFSG